MQGFRRWIAAGIVTVGTYGHTASAASVPGDQLPDGWHSDGGTPVAWNGTYVWLFDDAFDKMGADMMPAADAEIHRNAVVIDGEWIPDPLPTVGDGGYWWQDGYEMADGSLFVLVTEFVNDWTLAPPMQFVPVDTDAFIVEDPTTIAGWWEATHIEDGPWGDDSTSFVDGTDLVVARDPWDGLFGEWHGTQLYRFDPADPVADWDAIASNLPISGAVFVPVQTAAGWWGVSWGLGVAGEMNWHDVTLWYTPADELGTDTPWTEWATDRTALETHYHTLVVVDGIVLWRSNNLDGSRRPEYVDVTSLTAVA